jgi:hypothetical protein
MIILLAWGVGMGASDAGTSGVAVPSQLPTLGVGR